MPDKAIMMLNALIAVCEDGARTFRNATTHVEDRGLKKLFNDLALERDFVTAALRNKVRDLGGSPEEGGTVAGSTIRLYTDLKSALAGDDRAAILQEVQRSEERAAKRFQDALSSEDLAPDVRQAIETQKDRVLGSQELIKALRGGQD